MDRQLRQFVRERAEDRCEYCRLKQKNALLWRHQVEHVIPKKHGGGDIADNLAWACVRCNLGKSSNLSGIDSETGAVVTLFDPRTQNWFAHFRFDGAYIVGITPTGRATANVLNMNEIERVRLRTELLRNGELD